MLDPHGAVGKLALEESLQSNEIGVFVETAHPNKFQDIIIKAIPEHQLKKTSLDGYHKLHMANDFEQLKKILIES
jgi:threonine synthase